MPASPMPDDLRADEMPRLRLAYLLRVFGSLAFICATFSIITSHTTLQQERYDGHAASRSLYTVPASHPTTRNVTKGNTTKILTSVLNESNSSHAQHERPSFELHDSSRRSWPKKENLTLALPRSQHRNQSNVPPSLDKTGQNQPDVSRTLEEEQFILVEPRQKRASRERERRKQERMIRKRTWKEIQAERRHHVKDTCAQRPELREDLNKIIYSRRSRLSNFLVSDSHRIVFATVPMVASRFFEMLQQQQELQTNLSINSEKPAINEFTLGTMRNLSSYSGWEIRYRLSHYKKVVFVRDPFARIVSTYRRKFLPASTREKKMYGSLIAQNYKQGWQDNGEKGSGKSLNITFREFVYFVNAFTEYLPDSQWYPMSKIMLPCEISYDFIGKLEEGHQVFDNMLQIAKIESPSGYSPVAFSSTSHQGAIYDKYFLQLWPDQIREMYRLYKADFDLFQYSIPTYMRPWVFDKF